MTDSTFDPLELLAHLRSRWLTVAASCGLALMLALAVSVTLPKKYTATAEVLIQAPGGNDPRAATAVSPVYFESLKAYERLAASDTLFLGALEHVKMARAGGRSVESLKKEVLRVTKPTNTAILEISATTTDPVKAQALAQYIAEQTAEISRSVDSQSEIDLTREFRNQLDAATARLTKTRQAQATLQGTEPFGSLESQIENNADLKLKVEKDLSTARTELAGYLAEQQSLSQADASDVEFLRRATVSASARTAALEAQQRELVGRLAQQSQKLESWKIRQTALDADEKAARAAFETANTRLNDYRLKAGRIRDD